MMELNRRADVGEKMVGKGIENILKVLFYYGLNEKSVRSPKETTQLK